MRTGLGRNIRQQQPLGYNTTERSSYFQAGAPTILKPLNKPPVDARLANDGSIKFKLEEIERSLDKYYPPEYASKILKLIIYRVYQLNDDKLLNETLVYLRNVDRGIFG